MKALQKLMGVAMLAGATMAGAGAANAEGTFSGNVALTSDYVFRGLSQTDGNPAIQGGFDYLNGSFYAGTWASNVAFSSGPEIDVYAGFTPTVGPVVLNVGVIGYFYPGADDDAANFDFYEGKLAATFTPVDPLSVTGSLYYSPDFFGETDAALYLEIAAAYVFSDSLSFSGAYGNQTIDDVDGPGPGTVDGDYNTWNLGATYSALGFSFDLRYVDTDVDVGDSIATYTTADESLYDSAAVFTIKRAL